MLKRSLGLLIGVGLCVGCAAQQNPAVEPPAVRPEKAIVYVGTYTRGDSRGIYRLSLDTATGEMTMLGATGGIENPSFLAVHPTRKFLYAVAEIEEREGEKSGGVVAFSIDQSTGDLTALNQQASRGATPCHISIDGAGKNALVANYHGGNASVLPIAADGTLAPAAIVVQHEGGVDDHGQQQRALAHSINLDAQNRFAFVADAGLDEVRVYRFDGQTGKMAAHEPPWVSLSPRTGPRHFSFHPGGKYAYVNGETTSTVTSFVYDAGRGTLTETKTLSTLPAGHTGRNTTAEVVVHPNGRFVYVSNRGHDSVAIFSVNDDGTLTAAGHQSTGGKTPRNFAIDPTGTFLLAANQNTHNVVSFRIDLQTGALMPTGHEIDVPSPACIRYLNL